MIEIKEVQKAYGNHRVLENINLTLVENESMALMGESGAGKTTLLRVIAGLEPVQKGEVWIDGQLRTSPRVLVHPSERNLSFVFQFPVLWPHMTVYQNITYGLDKSAANEKKAELHGLMRDFGIDPIKMKHSTELSGGEKKRVSIIRSLIMNRQYVLMDEPLVHLDKELKRNLIELIKMYIAKNNMTLLYVTHDEETLEWFDFSTVKKLSGGLVKE